MSNSTAARVMPRPNPRPVARAAAPPRLRVVARRTGRSRAGLAVLCISMLVVGMITLLLLNISLSNGAYELTSLQKTQIQASEQQEALAEQVDALSSPQQLAQRAADLGMVPVPNTAFVRLSDDTILGTPSAAQAPPKRTAKTSAVTGATGVTPKKKDRATTTDTVKTGDKAKTGDRTTTSGDRTTTSGDTTTTSGDTTANGQR